ncbi:DUF4421 family protein [Chryseobacterium sp. DT-3]|uniref:DUF4421 family protein n=1 Tax=Chryseobacterium sp. DT-3 TaxID=3396164 RepID=UPI003F1DB900
MKFLYLFIFLCSFTGYSQTEKPNKEKFEIDTSYIKSFSEKVVLKANVDNKINEFNVKNNDVLLKFVPNITHKYNISVEYDFLSLSIGLPKSWTGTETDNQKKGRTQGFDISFTIFKNHWMQSVYYNQTKGFYIKNTHDLLPFWTDDSPYVQFPDFKVMKVGGSTSYVINAKKLSFRAVNNQTEMQKKSAGSFIFTANYNYTQLDNKEENQKSNQNRYNIIPEISYQYNWVLLNKNLLLSGRAGSGYGFSYAQDKSGQNKKTYGTGILDLNLNLSLNYQWKNFFAGIQHQINFQNYKEDGFKVNYTLQYSNLYVGYRFNAPKVLQKSSEWIKNKVDFL